MSAVSNNNAIVFHNKPHHVVASEDHNLKPPRYDTAQELLQSIEESGPLIAVAKVGPSAYNGPCFQLKNKVQNHDIFGWKPGTAKEHSSQVTVMLLGMQIFNSKAHVFYTPAVDTTTNQTSLTRVFKPSLKDRKIYIMSYDNFLYRGLVDLHPTVKTADDSKRN